ncbi:MAG: tRNA pseudouridine(38-40) synthase TruA [Prevotellaceae bacterium]|jgi:tRNA pseudouridine38-40 synthase|nr:tRNA pseudouridine(38-40) synthase TruA [Prevotellaceae bacterium]
MIRIKIDLSFKGTNYHGWQIQENANTVQEELNRALSLLLRENIETTGCGRTDSGVHARQYIVHFDCKKGQVDFQNIRFKLNALLSKDIAINAIQETYPGFHARFDAVKRTYKYFIHNHKNPFFNELSTFVPHDLDLTAMNHAANLLLGTKDFTSFCKLHSDVTNNRCTVYEARWETIDNQYVFTISANRFLRNMVRAIVGTMLDLGRNKINGCKSFQEIIDAQERCTAGVSAPACGLFLWEVKYV